MPCMCLCHGMLLKAYKFTVLENLRDFLYCHACAIQHSITNICLTSNKCSHMLPSIVIRSQVYNSLCLLIPKVHGQNFNPSFSFFLILEIPPPPPELRYRIDSSNCICERPEIDATVVTCTCQNNDLVLFWETASGNFDVLHYFVSVSTADGNITTQNYTNATSFSVPIMRGVEFLAVSVSTVSVCGQMSDAAVPENSTNGVVSVGKYLNKVCHRSYPLCPMLQCLAPFHFC